MLCLLLVLLITAGCAGPGLATPDEHTVVPSPSVTTAPPTAAVGATTGAPCESGTLRIKDLTEISKRWLDGVRDTRQRALAWQDDAYLVELAISCELFEAGFRWQTTYFSRVAQSFFRSDTSEIIPANANPDTIILLPMGDIDFEVLMGVLLADPGLQLQTTYLISTLEVRVNTATRPMGPGTVPLDVPIYHVTVQAPGRVLELYVDIETKQIFQYTQ
ncbi:MAG TPA: hypothetical protein PK819_09400 [Thermomicrobiales bacterium]|nr:hypothetical protein [Thermomicrobiales bacterium]